MDLSTRIADLLRPAAFAHPATNLRLIETHISWVLLAGAYAYKLRKPVNFGFLDFSSLENRQADCLAEIDLNRRLCPDLYLGLVDVVERDGRLAIGGAGQRVEPAVWMRRLPDSGMLPALLERGAAGEHLMQRVARQLADFHKRAATGPGVDEHGSPRAIGANWNENFVQTTACSNRMLPRAHREAIRRYIDEFLVANAPLLERRIEQGRIRDGHGDLHAGSVCVMRRRLYLFDCIQFNARFRCADVAAEVAFLAMDLDHLGRADLAHAFVEVYVRYSGDAELLALLDFYKCYRAYVRGKVLGFRLDEPGIAPDESRRMALEARAYFDLAYSYATPLAHPILLVTMGLPASGKTTLANALASRLGLVHLSAGVIAKRLIDTRSPDHRLEGFERGLYSRSVSRRTYALLRRDAARWLRRRRSVVLDATYGQPAERAALRQLARRAAVRLITLVCRADEQVLQARLVARIRASQTTSEPRVGLWPTVRAAFVEPTDLSAIVVDTARPVEQVVDEVIAAISGARSLGSPRAA